MKIEGNAVFERLVGMSLVQEYEQAFLQATGISLSLVPASATSAPPFHVGKHEPELCRLLSKNYTASLECRKCEEQLLKCADETLSAQMVNCFAGLTVVAAPVTVRGEHIATWISRQTFSRKPTRAEFRILKKKLTKWGMAGELPQIEKCLFRNQAVGHNSHPALKQLLGLFARHLSEHAERSMLISQVHEPQIVKQAKSFIQSHLYEELSLETIARGAHVSPFHLCRVFHSSTGLTLKEYIAELRVEQVKKLLANFTLRICEVAFEAGFGSIPQFNSVFRKVTGRSPTQYRASIQKQTLNGEAPGGPFQNKVSTINGSNLQTYRNNQAINSNRSVDHWNKYSLLDSQNSDFNGFH